MRDFENMDIGELIAFRDKICAQEEKQRAEFRAAGKVLDAKRQSAKLVLEYELLEAKRAALREKIGEPEPKKTVLKTLFGG